jgi:hypothetical protein
MRSGVKEILRIVSTFPDDCFYNVSDESWMETSHFQEWFDRVFVENTKSTDGPKLLIFDGHVSSITLEIVNSAKRMIFTLLFTVTYNKCFTATRCRCIQAC